MRSGVGLRRFRSQRNRGFVAESGVGLLDPPTSKQRSDSKQKSFEASGRLVERTEAVSQR